MKEKQLEFLEKIRSKGEDLSELQLDYFKSFTDVATWQFWAVFLALLVPLTLIFLFIDRKRIFLLGFFGLNYHIWFAYTNVIGVGMGLWEYPYQPFPFLPGFALDASLVPVCFMFLYQWTIHRKKNIYLYAIILSAVLAFILKPIMVAVDFFHMYKGINYFYLFLFYIAFFIVSKLITNIFLWLHQRNNT